MSKMEFLVLLLILATLSVSIFFYTQDEPVKIEKAIEVAATASIDTLSIDTLKADTIIIK